MRKILTTAAILLAAAITLAAGVMAQTPTTSSATELKTDKEKASYAIGMNIGGSMKRDGVEVDPAILVQGMKDALAGDKLLLTEDEARAAITTLQKETKEKQEAKMKVLGEENKKEGEAFLAANKSKEGIVTLPSGLQYKIEKQGDGPKPKPTDTIECNYSGALINGKEFDSSYKRGKPASFAVTGVIPGMSEILQLMPVGSKYQVFIPSNLAYKDRGAGAEIGPNATLIFELEVLSIKEKPTALHQAMPITPPPPPPTDAAPAHAK